DSAPAGRDADRAEHQVVRLRNELVDTRNYSRRHRHFGIAVVDEDDLVDGILFPEAGRRVEPRMNLSAEAAGTGDDDPATHGIPSVNTPLCHRNQPVCPRRPPRPSQSYLR